MHAPRRTPPFRGLHQAYTLSPPSFACSSLVGFGFLLGFLSGFLYLNPQVSPQVLPVLIEFRNLCSGFCKTFVQAFKFSNLLISAPFYRLVEAVSSCFLHVHTDDNNPKISPQLYCERKYRPIVLSNKNILGNIPPRIFCVVLACMPLLGPMTCRQASGLYTPLKTNGRGPG